MINVIKINGYILAGGKSSRMGTDKGLLQFRGKPLIGYTIEKLKPAVSELVIVSNNSDYSAFGLEVISDIIKDAGPAGGIHSALNHTKSKLNIIVSCDMPFISIETINFLIRNSGNSQIVLTEHNNKKEPLFALYSKDCLDEWESLILKNILSLQKLILNFNARIINVDNNILFSSNHFYNVNSQKDLSEINKIKYHEY